ncbi:MAG: thioester reductase domain-containing protein [Pseudomonadota bacterium]|nr:thioester reductase domain-containing protein [Pseudomonadota bacterium]
MTSPPDNLAAELALDDDLGPTSPYRAVSEPQVVFLTGGTGFLGAFVLHDLLRYTRATIHCLVRAKDADTGRQRLAANLAHYQLVHPDIASRVVAVPGSMEMPGLGIDEPTYDWLAEQVDTVYHLAADVSFMPGYEQLRASNVTGLIHVLRFACERRTKNVHYTSTYAVFNSDAYTLARRVHETRLAGTSAGFHRGYDRTKWVAEHLVGLMQERGLPVALYRAGFISGDTRTGIHNKMDPVAQMLAVALCTGYAIRVEALLHLTPVDYASRALVKLSLLREAENQIFHLVQGQPKSAIQILDWMVDEGYGVKMVEFAEWYEQLKLLCRRYPQFIPAFYLSSRGEAKAFGEGENISGLYFDATNVERLLPADERCPSLDTPLLRRYFDYIASPDRGYQVVVRGRARG